MNDPFFDKTNCDRCGGNLQCRTMSWFNNDTICMNCSDKEAEIKKALKDQGKDPRSFEGCGHLPNVETTTDEA